MRQKIQIVVGPTASGKTGLGIRLAQKLAYEGISAAILNMDSMQLYAELPILTAQPDAQEKAQAPHLLYGILPARDACSAARYADMAASTIRELQGQGIVPILVGGTGLYLKVLLEGIATIPAIEEDVRRDARALQAQIGSEALHARLAAVDAETATRLMVGDTQRIVRAWEVYRQTGKPISQWQKQSTLPVIDAAAWEGIVLMPPREKLYAKIDSRFDLMMDAGVVDEVAALLSQELDPALPAMKATGLPELAGYIRGELGRDVAVARARQMSRNYAKRQVTWFSNQILARYEQARRYDVFGTEVG